MPDHPLNCRCESCDQRRLAHASGLSRHDLWAGLSRALIESEKYRKPEPPRPILNVVHGLPATLLGVPIVVECGEG